MKNIKFLLIIFFVLSGCAQNTEQGAQYSETSQGSQSSQSDSPYTDADYIQSEAIYKEAEWISNNEIVLISSLSVDLWDIENGSIRKIYADTPILGSGSPMGITVGEDYIYSFDGQGVVLTDKNIFESEYMELDGGISDRPISIDGKVVYSRDNRLILSEMKNPSNETVIKEGDPASEELFHYAKFSPDGEYIAYMWSEGYATHGVVISRMDGTDEVIYRPSGEDVQVGDYYFTSDGKKLIIEQGSSMSDGELVVYDFGQGKVIKSVDMAELMPEFITVTVADMEGEHILLWALSPTDVHHSLYYYHLQTGEIKQIPTEDTQINSVAFSPDAQRIVLCRQGVGRSAEVWSLSDF